MLFDPIAEINDGRDFTASPKYVLMQPVLAINGKIAFLKAKIQERNRKNRMKIEEERAP
jgi:hypothetical protein